MPLDKREKYAHWEDIALYDLETAEAMLLSGRYLYVVFMCQQAVEKITKGLYVLHLEDEPPRTHNINLILRNLFDNCTFSDSTIEKQTEYTPFFVRLLAYYISERYPSYREKLSQVVSREAAQEVLDKTKEVFAWLQSLGISKE